MTIPIGVQKEMEDALEDSRAYLDERGNDVILRTNDEGDVIRDRYGSIKKRVPVLITLHSYPTTFNPTQEDLRKAGIKENVDIIMTFSTKQFTNNSLSYEGVDERRWEFEVEGNLYTPKDKNQTNHFSHSYLNIIIGATKK